MPLRAYDAASTAATQAAVIAASAGSLAQAYAALTTLRARAASVQKQG